MMKGSLGGGSKKEGKMRIRAFPVSLVVLSSIQILTLIGVSVVFVDDDG